MMTYKRPAKKRILSDEQKTIGHFLALEEIGHLGENVVYRWIEHRAIWFRIESATVAHVISPMGGRSYRISPYIFFEPQNRLEMMKIKKILNRGIVFTSEPQNHKCWGIET